MNIKARIEALEHEAGIAGRQAECRRALITALTSCPAEQREQLVALARDVIAGRPGTVPQWETFLSFLSVECILFAIIDGPFQPDWANDPWGETFTVADCMRSAVTLAQCMEDFGHEYQTQT